MIKNLLKNTIKTVGIGFGLINKFIPNGFLVELVFIGYKELAKRTSTPYDNEIGKLFIEKSHLTEKEKAQKIRELDG